VKQRQGIHQISSQRFVVFREKHVPPLIQFPICPVGSYGNALPEIESDFVVACGEDCRTIGLFSL
jgi:hypothetical protein